MRIMNGRDGLFEARGKQSQNTPEGGVPIKHERGFYYAVSIVGFVANIPLDVNQLCERTRSLEALFDEVITKGHDIMPDEFGL